MEPDGEAPRERLRDVAQEVFPAQVGLLYGNTVLDRTCDPLPAEPVPPLPVASWVCGGPTDGNVVTEPVNESKGRAAVEHAFHGILTWNVKFVKEEASGCGRPGQVGRARGEYVVAT